MDMSVHCRQGFPLAESLSNTGIRVSKRLRATLEVGQQRGRVAEELAAFARSKYPNVAHRLARSLGRPQEVTRFALALSRLLIDHRLTVNIISDASTLASGKGSRFDRVIAQVIEDMRSGDLFAESLRQHPKYFDSFFCDVVAACSGRDQLLQTLLRLTGHISMNSPYAMSHS
jgi:type II secretory pathway component PulF